MKRMLRRTGLVLLTQKTISQDKTRINIETDKEKSQANPFNCSDTNELRQPSTPLGVVKESLDDTIIILGDLPEAGNHMVTVPIKNMLRQSCGNSNTTKTQGPQAEHLFLVHPQPTDPVSHIAQAIQMLARKNQDNQFSTHKVHSLSTENWSKTRNLSISKTFFPEH